MSRQWQNLWESSSTTPSKLHPTDCGFYIIVTPVLFKKSVFVFFFLFLRQSQKLNKGIAYRKARATNTHPGCLLSAQNFCGEQERTDNHQRLPPSLRPRILIDTWPAHHSSPYNQVSQPVEFCSVYLQHPRPAFPPVTRNLQATARL
jgi:hypothetical protein